MNLQNSTEKKGITFIVADGSKEIIPTSIGYYKEDVILWLDEKLDDNEGKNVVILQHEIPLDTVHYVVDIFFKNNITTALNSAPAANVPLKTIYKVAYLTPNENEVWLVFGEDKKLENLFKKYSKS